MPSIGQHGAKPEIGGTIKTLFKTHENSMGKPYGAFHNNDGGSELQMAIQAWRPTELYLLEGGSRFLGLIITPR